MIHLLSILLPIATLIIGSILTMAGQALSDRRQETRELKARKDQFRADNFDMHRTAMLAMQEAVRSLDGAVTAEETRRQRSGGYGYFDSHHKDPGDLNQLLIDDAQWLEQMNGRLKEGPLSEEESENFTAEIKRRNTRFSTAVPKTVDSVKQSGDLLQQRISFYEEFVKSAGDIRLCMQRSGSDTVVRYGQEHLHVVSKWALNLVSADREKLTQEIRKSRDRLDRALANALRNGPYDKFTFTDDE